MMWKIYLFYFLTLGVFTRLGGCLDRVQCSSKLETKTRVYTMVHSMLKKIFLYTRFRYKASGSSAELTLITYCYLKIFHPIKSRIMVSYYGARWLPHIPVCVSTRISALFSLELCFSRAVF
jgi:hypothetical protein